jgi:RNA polymerase sigma-70 factor (ECF subfamily)
MATAVSPSPAPLSPTAISADALVALRADMMRFARLQLHNPEAAEDMVQESLEAALRNAPSFAGRSTLKTWVFSILRNKIVDHIRLAARTVPMSSLVEDGDDWQERLESMFNERGGWRNDPRPTTWPGPHEAMENRQFWVVFEACLAHLPGQTGRVFMMREFLGFDCEEICAQLGITISNCHVILHRARLKLRACMEVGWGRSGGPSC